MKQIIEFIEKHSRFFKKVIIFFIAYIAISLANNPIVETLINKLFGEYLSQGIHALIPTILITSEI